MSELIRRMQEQWAVNARAEEAARRRAIWAEIGHPREVAFRLGFKLAQQWQSGQPIADPASAALAEGFYEGLQDFMRLGWAGTWRFSKARKDALAAAESAANG